MDKNCINCRFVDSQQQMDANGNAVIGQYVHSCRFGPPQMFMAPGPNNTVALSAGFPPVGPGIVCAQHEYPASLESDAVDAA